MTPEIKPIKCASKDFRSNPFYLIQENGPDQRFVASIQVIEKIKHFLITFINSSEGDLQIKIRDSDNHENPQDYNGAGTKSDILNALEKHEQVIFHDGFHDLMLRRPETGEYITFDEHGLIFIYTEITIQKLWKNLDYLIKKMKNLSIIMLTGIIGLKMDGKL